MNTPIPFHQIQAIFFDLDGTLIKTDEAVVARVENRLQSFLGQRAAKIARSLLMKAETPGNQFITLLDFFGLDKPLTKFTDKLRRRRGFYPSKEFTLMRDVADLLLDLNGRYLAALVTTRSRYQIADFLARFPEETAVFQTTCGLQDTSRLKPHPAPVQLAARRLGVSVEHCLMVGDTAIDIKSARRAGVWSVGVLCGLGERDEFERAGAHLILDCTADLRTHLRTDTPGRSIEDAQQIHLP